MGIPYSKEIHMALDQVTPLVKAGFRVLETTRNISLLVALVQMLNVVLLSLILLTLVGLLITVNPELRTERREIVSPVVGWIASWVGRAEDRRFLEWLGVVILGGVALGGWIGVRVTREVPERGEDGEGTAEGDKDKAEEDEDEDGNKLRERGW